MAPRRKVFVSYHHHGDSAYYEIFSTIFSQTYEIVQDHSVEREIDSDNSDYVIRRIRERYLYGASATIVLCGSNTWGRKFVDWEILASLNQGMALIGIILPTNVANFDGLYAVPGRLHENIKSGYAAYDYWGNVVANPLNLSVLIENAIARDKRLINNNAAKRLRNAPLR